MLKHSKRGHPSPRDRLGTPVAGVATIVRGVPLERAYFWGCFVSGLGYSHPQLHLPEVEVCWVVRAFPVFPGTGGERGLLEELVGG